MNSHLVSVEWLNKHLDDSDLIVLDATMPKVTSEDCIGTDLEVIPNAVFFDIKTTFSDSNSPFPNTISGEQQFEKEVQALGINQNSIIVVYDNLGIYSSPRVWWLFKTFGFNRVYVLNGGLPEWKKKLFKTASNYFKVKTNGDFKALYQPNKIVYFESLPSIIEDVNITIIDARSSERFQCIIPEPRAGLRSGTIPNSINLPYEQVLENGCLKSKEQLQQLFKSLLTTDQLIFTCGSGLTASILDLAASEAGYQNTSVYDGSWTEYGTLKSD